MLKFFNGNICFPIQNRKDGEIVLAQVKAYNTIYWMMILLDQMWKEQAQCSYT